jgi:hypothetical protein
MEDKWDWSFDLSAGRVLAENDLSPTLHDFVQMATGVVEAFKALRTPTSCSQS